MSEARTPTTNPPPFTGEVPPQAAEGGALSLGASGASPRPLRGPSPRKRGENDLPGPEIVTFGCRLNAYESEVIRELTDGAGLHDSVIVNTCAVTNEATRQARQAIRRIARERPQASIVVTGCGAQIEPEAFAVLPGVARIVGNREKLEAKTWRGSHFPGIAVSNIFAAGADPAHGIAQFRERARAYVEVQNGCDHRCTFCIIPFGRGNSRSVPAEAVTTQIRALAGSGFNEVVLTGVDLTSWGADLEGEPSLAALVRAILREVPELARLRLSSIDPAEVDEELIALFAGEERLMPHIHLSLQAGDDMILKRMKRRHSREGAIFLTERIRHRRPGVAFGADLIAGFPTETKEMFERSLSIIEACGLAFVHVFPFSARKGTPAARMPQVGRPEVKARAAALRERAKSALRAQLEGQAGREGELLVERGRMGRLPNFMPARLDVDAAPGALVRARIIGVEGDHLVAERI